MKNGGMKKGSAPAPKKTAANFGMKSGYAPDAKTKIGTGGKKGKC